MATRKKSKPAEKKQQAHHGVWGILCAALGVLVFMSLMARFMGRPEVLGPVFGVRLSSGLVRLFGTMASLVFPLAMVAAGVRQIRGNPPSGRALLLWAVLAAETSAILAVHNIRYVTRGSFPFTDNLLGNGLTYLLHHVFGPHPLGPYFLLGVGVVVSLILLAHVNVVTVSLAVADTAKRISSWVSNSLAELATARIDEGPQVNLDGTSEDDEEEDEELDEEKLRQLEQDRALFRAKKNAPITITTYDSEPVVDVEAEAEERAADERGEDEEEDGGEEKSGFQPSTPKRPAQPYQIPSPDILTDPPQESTSVDTQHIHETSEVLERTLLNFGVEGKVVNVSPGPVINRYEIELAPGIKVSKVVNLQDDISLAVGGLRIRIQAPIPGKSAVGIELPNPQRDLVYFKHVLTSEAFRRGKAKLPVIIGKSISGAPYVTDINRMPHLLIAGQTGSGKSVCINCIICSLLMTKTPEELRMIMVDPKKVELAAYEGIPHLMSPVVTESKEAVKALQWGVIEMERRYRLLAKVGARDIESFNNRVAQGKIPEGVLDEKQNKPLPFIVILVDELADLMMTASRDVETQIMRVAQLARAVGLHLIVATQRPSVDIITGPIKANLTSRIAFRTIQSTDSRTILGHVGAEKLLGMGDMLFLRNGAPDIERFHGAYITEEDVERLVGFIREQYVEVEKIESFEKAVPDPGSASRTGGQGGGHDELFPEAARVIVEMGQGSTSLLQRRLKLGYARAGRLMDELEQAGIVSAQEGTKMREVLIRPDELEQILSGQS